MGCESEPDDAAPAGWDLDESKVDSLVHGDGAVAEADSVAEGFETAGAATVVRQLNVIAVRCVEEHRPTLHGALAEVIGTWNYNFNPIIAIVINFIIIVVVVFLHWGTGTSFPRDSEIIIKCYCLGGQAIVLRGYYFYYYY